ncbi:hypothetical protein, partial [Paenibacillus validus]|uniref:hypothetical protein n=1 Tax=Paenibacillus validus TaxID=44253 RepID=UPI002E217DAF|nr:hypothetical protein [Paenibacillus validus]
PQPVRSEQPYPTPPDNRSTVSTATTTSHRFISAAEGRRCSGSSLLGGERRRLGSSMSFISWLVLLG